MNARSPDRSEWRPLRYMNTHAKRNGNAESNVTTRSLSVDTERTISGRKTVMPMVANA